MYKSYSTRFKNSRTLDKSTKSKVSFYKKGKNFIRSKTDIKRQNTKAWRSLFDVEK